MAFFGLFNYAKEGPGIAKDAPKKKTFFVFFETFFRNFWKFIPINLVYSLISIPVLTIGLANAGLTNVARNTARDKHSFGLSDFWDTIKANWRQALPVGIINTIIYALLVFDIYFFYVSSFGYLSPIGIGISIALLVVFYMMNFYIWTMMITFNFTIKQIYSNSFKFVFINMKNNLICTVCMILSTAFFVAVFAALSYFKDIIFGGMITVILSAILLPLFKFLIIQYNVFPSIKKYVIDPYYEAHPEEDIEKRRNLGIEVEADEEETEEDDTVFND